MTIIAYRSGIMAADTALWRDDCIAGSMRKIARSPDGGLAGAAGCVSISEWFLRRVERGDALEDAPEDEDDSGFQFIVVRPDGTVFRGGRSLVMVPLVSHWHCIGLSSMFTQGALAAGASAEEAVRLTVKWAAWSGGDVQVERLGNP